MGAKSEIEEVRLGPFAWGIGAAFGGLCLALFVLVAALFIAEGSYETLFYAGPCFGLPGALIFYASFGHPLLRSRFVRADHRRGVVEIRYGRFGEWEPLGPLGKDAYWRIESSEKSELVYDRHHDRDRWSTYTQYRLFFVDARGGEHSLGDIEGLKSSELRDRTRLSIHRREN